LNVNRIIPEVAVKNDSIGYYNLPDSLLPAGLFYFMTMRDSMIIYRSFFEAISEIPKENQAEVWQAVFEYGLNFKEIELSGLSKTIFTLIKPQLDANIKKFHNGKKPKHKQNGSKSEANDKQEISKTEANLKQKISKTEANVNDNVNDNVNEESEVLTAEFLFDEFKRQKGMALPFFDRMLKVYQVENIMESFKKWFLITQGKIKNMNHAENSFRKYLESEIKEKQNEPEMPRKHPKSTLENNWW
jgi:hypothetical protein